MAIRRYIVKSAVVTYGSIAGELDRELWHGFEVDGELDLAYLSQHGYDFIPADGFTEEMLQSVGVAEFEMIVICAELGE